MGNGIAQVAATSGYRVTLMDVLPEQLERAKTSIAGSVEKLFSKEKITVEQKETALNIPMTTSLEGAADAELVIEAASEDLDLKLDVFRDLDQITPSETILASNTSSISLTKIGAATQRPDKVIGMHFMNPVPLMRLVEIIRGLSTSDETTQKVWEKSLWRRTIHQALYPTASCAR